MPAVSQILSQTGEPNPHLQDYRLHRSVRPSSGVSCCIHFLREKKKKRRQGPSSDTRCNTAPCPDLLNPAEQIETGTTRHYLLYCKADEHSFLTLQVWHNKAPRFVTQFISNLTYSSSLLLLLTASFLPLHIFVLNSIFSLATPCFYSSTIATVPPSRLSKPFEIVTSHLTFLLPFLKCPPSLSTFINLCSLAVDKVVIVAFLQSYFQIDTTFGFQISNFTIPFFYCILPSSCLPFLPSFTPSLPPSLPSFLPFCLTFNFP